MLLAARDELQQSAAAGMSIDDWHQKWDGATLNGTSLLSSSLSPGAQRATGSVATGEEATLVERAAGLSLQEKQELATELKIMEQVQSLSKQQRKQFASSVGANPAAAAATGAPITAQKFAEIEVHKACFLRCQPLLDVQVHFCMLLRPPTEMCLSVDIWL